MDLLINELTQEANDQIARDHDEALNKEHNRRDLKIHEDERKAEELRIQKEKLKAEQEEQKRKDDLKKLHEDVEQQIVEKGAWMNDILNQPISNIHGNFQAKPTVGVFGGLLGQIAIALTAAIETLGNDNFINEPSAYKFFAILISDVLRSESYELLLGNDLEKYILENGGKLDELNLLDENIQEHIIEESKESSIGDELFNNFTKNLDKYGINTDVMKLLILSLMRTIFLRFTEKALQGKQGNARKKLKLVTVPPDFKYNIKRPQAIVRIRIPLDRTEDENEEANGEMKDENNEEPKDEEGGENAQENKEEEKKIIEKVYPELEYDDKVLTITPVTESLHIFISHQAAARELRNQICEIGRASCRERVSSPV